jgi:hypothetical protein
MNKELNELIAVGQHDKIFPLFNRQDLAKRWEKTTGGVTWIFQNHENAPKPINEIFQSVPYREYYPYFEVLRYEKERGIK